MMTILKDLRNKTKLLEEENLGLRRKLTRIEGYSILGFYQRRFFEELLTKEVSRAKRHHRPFSLVMVRLKGFKEKQLINRLALLVQKTVLREIDISGRLSSRYLGFILPETTKIRALLVSQKIKEKIEKLGGKDIKVDLGVVSCPYEATSKDELIQRVKEDLSKKTRSPQRHTNNKRPRMA